MLVLALLLSLGPNGIAAGDPNDLTKGSALFRGCEAELRLMSLPSLTQAGQSDLLNGTYCVGYVNGFVSHLRSEDAVCPQGAPTEALVKVYVSYMKEHTELMNQERGLGLTLALRDGFSCSSAPDIPHTGAVLTRAALVTPIRPYRPE